MDIVYDKFLNTFHRENQAIENKKQKFSDFFPTKQDMLLPFVNKEVSITKLNNGKYFVSNCRTKGFFLERNSDIEKLKNISAEYKELQKSIGKISDLFGFTDRCFENVVEAFSNDDDSVGLGDFTAEFLGRSNHEKIVGVINIDSLFTIAYEANGNRIVLDKDNRVYIYAHDLVAHHYQIVKGVPKNTFYKVPNINSLTEFIIAFLEDFFSL